MTTKAKTSKAELESEHQSFMGKFPEYLDRIKELIQQNTLTYHPDEIHQVELLYNSMIAKSRDSETDAAELDNMFVCYFGNAFIHYFGGEWRKATYPKNILYGFSVIIRYGGEGYRWVEMPPAMWLRAIRKGKLKVVSEDIKWRLEYFAEHPEHGIKVNKDLI